MALIVNKAAISAMLLESKDLIRIPSLNEEILKPRSTFLDKV